MRYGKRNYIIAWLCIVSLVFQSGCVSTALRPSSSVVPEQEIAEIGTVGVATARFDPVIGLEDITSGKGTGALKGAGKGALTGANLFSGGGSCSGGSICGVVALLQLLLMAAGATVGAIVGGVSGALEAEPAEKVEDTKAKAQAVFAELKFQESMREHVVKYAREEVAITVVAFAETGPTSPDEQFNYQALASQKVDKILEVSVLSVGTEGGGFLEPDPPLSLVIRARARLVRVKDGQALTVLDYAFRSKAHKLSEWADNNLQRFNAALERGYQQIAEEVVDEMFLLYYPSRPKPEVQSEGTQQLVIQRESIEKQAGSNFPLYVLRAEYPEVRHCFKCEALFASKPNRSWGNVEFVKIKELQPTLQWEPFPWPDDLQTSEAQKQVTDVTYELKVYHALPAELVLVPGEQIYLRKGLAAPYHQLEQPLEPCAEYFWTVRARFKLDSRYRVTEWAGTYPLGGDPWDLRRPKRSFVGGGLAYMKFLESSWSYYPFKTSAQEADKNCPR
ncbi:MAG TPA: hypothetical protein VIW72_01850 [Burkholderiales bacterium]